MKRCGYPIAILSQWRNMECGDPKLLQPVLAAIQEGMVENRGQLFRR